MSRAACKEEACAYLLESKVNTVRGFADMGACTDSDLLTAASIYERAAEYLDAVIHNVLERGENE